MLREKAKKNLLCWNQLYNQHNFCVSFYLKGGFFAPSPFFFAFEDKVIVFGFPMAGVICLPDFIANSKNDFFILIEN